MPILTESSQWIDPDKVRRPVVTFGADVADAAGMDMDLHHHRKGEIIFVERGALACEVEGSLWTVPPRSAVWIPGGMPHSVTASGALEGYVAFVDPAVSTLLPEACCAVSVSSLLRELLLRSARLPDNYDESGPDGRLVAVLLDELAVASIENLHLPMPVDPRLRKIAELILATPDDRVTITAWAERIGLGERTLARMIKRETGMTFSRWRQQLSVMLAVKWLAGGASIQQAASDLGYESVPSFATMFRKVLGASPGRYMAERRVRDDDGTRAGKL